MLANNYFYYKLLRKYVIVFGTIFNDITILRAEKNSNTEINRWKVPIVYGPKDHFVTRLESDPDVLREFQNILPRMSFEITGINYDVSRKQNSLLRVGKGDNASRVSSQYMGVPYDINFELNVYAKTIDDGNHIAEQIMPYFNPDYTLTMTPVTELGFLKDIPIILNNVTNNISYEGGHETVRFVNWSFSFTLKGYFFGPISTPKIIRKSIANIFNDPSIVAGNVIRMNTNIGNNGTFQILDTVYQGKNYDTATAYGKVTAWDAGSRKLIIGGAHGDWKLNGTIKAVSTNASYTLVSFDASPLNLAKIVVEPNPIDAQPGDDFGYTTTITEWPDTEYPKQPSNNNPPSADSNLFTADNNNITADTE